MINEKPLTETQALITPEQKLKDLAVQLDLLDTELEDPVNTMYGALHAEDRATQEQLESQFQAHILALEREPNRYEQYNLMFKVIQESGNSELSAKVADAAEFSLSRLAEAATLESTAEALSNEEFRKTREMILVTTDWQAVIARYASKEAYNDLRSTLSIFNLEVGKQPLEFRTAHSYINVLKQQKQDFAEQGDVLAEGVQAIPDGWLPNSHLGDAIYDWKESVQEVEKYLASSRKAFVSSAMPSDVLNGIVDLCSGVLLQSDHDPDMVPPVIAYALEQQAELVAQEFYAQDERYLQESLNERPNALFIGNQKLLRETTDISNVPDWVHMQMARHPSGMTRGIGFVNFVNGFGEEPIQGDGIERSKLGTTDTLENTITIDIGNRRIAALLNGESNPNDDFIMAVKELNRRRITDTLDHELTHYAHRHRIPVAWLQAWQSTIKTEQVNVTDYVDDMRSSNLGKSGHADFEDLCESTSMYLNKPWTLLNEAPHRFALLNARDSRYSEAMINKARTIARVAGNSASPRAMDTILSGDADRNHSQAASS